MVYNYDYFGREMFAFDHLPQEIRTMLNESDIFIEPRFVLGIYKTRGTEATKKYLEGLMIREPLYG